MGARQLAPPRRRWLWHPPATSRVQRVDQTTPEDEIGRELAFAGSSAATDVRRRIGVPCFIHRSAYFAERHHRTLFDILASTREDFAHRACENPPTCSRSGLRGDGKIPVERILVALGRRKASGFNESIHRLLEGRHYAVLTTHDDDGSIHLTPVWYIFDNKELCVGAPSSSRKARNIAARPSASLIVDTRRLGMERWVSASANAEIIEDERSREINSQILRRYLTKEAIEDARIGPAFTATDDVTICLTPIAWRS